MAIKKKILPPRTDDPKEMGRWYTRVCEEINKDQVGTCTLTANAVTTTVTDSNVFASSKIYLTPTSANAAADVGSATGVYISSVSDGSFIITHPNNANSDKTFNYIVRN